MAPLSIQHVRKIAVLHREDGRDVLRKCLGWESFDEEDDKRRSIELDFIYDHLMHTIQHGFPWVQICTINTLTQKLLQNSLGKSLPQAIKLYMDLCRQHEHLVSVSHLKIYTNFVFESFFKHFLLYQYVFTTDQEHLTISYDLHVETPVEPMNFCAGQSEQIWEYNQKIQELEAKEEKVTIDRQEAKKEQDMRDNMMIQKTYKTITDVEPPLDKQKLVEIIREVSGVHTTAVSHAIESLLYATVDSVNYKLEKTALPRPAELDDAKYDSLDLIDEEEDDVLEELSFPQRGVRLGARAASKLGGPSRMGMSSRSERTTQNQTRAGSSISKLGPPPRYTNRAKSPNSRPTSKNSRKKSATTSRSLSRSTKNK